jgi:ADP-ribosyl-[dinitrogen reductase] hydrolase
MPDRVDRIEGAMLGVLVGDALGVPYEFHPADQIADVDAIEMDPPPGFHRAHGGTPPGTCSPRS